MSKEEKIKLIKDCLKTMEQKILRNIDKMPEEWNGFELRQYIDDIAHHEVNHIKMDIERKKKYLNDILMNNI